MGSLRGDTRLHLHMTERGSWKSLWFRGCAYKQLLLYPNTGVETEKQAVSSAGFFFSIFFLVETRRRDCYCRSLATSHLKGPRPGMHGQNTSTTMARAGCRGSLPCSVPQEQELDEWVCEVHKAALGDAGDPQPVVQNVQVHIEGVQRRPTPVCVQERMRRWKLPSIVRRC